MADMQKQINEAKVGGKFMSRMTIDNQAAQEVSIHCVEVTGSKKRFKVFSHGVEIREVQATKEGSTWTPK